MGKGKTARDRHYKNFKKIGYKIEWDDYVYILTRYYGFEMFKDTGSSARAFTRDEVTFTAYEPHGKRRGNKFVNKSDHRRAINAVERLELLENGGEE